MSDTDMRLKTRFLLLFAALFFQSASADEIKSETEQACRDDDERKLNCDASQKTQRPALETKKLSPKVRVTPPEKTPDGKMRRVVPLREKSPLQHVPVLRGLMPDANDRQSQTQNSDAPVGTDSTPPVK